MARTMFSFFCMVFVGKRLHLGQRSFTCLVNLSTFHIPGSPHVYEKPTIRLWIHKNESFCPYTPHCLDNLVR